MRYSLTNPSAYTDSNIVGFLNILEACRNNRIQNFLFASSSSVYGMNEMVPFSERDSVDHPISLYAATKKANELMAHAYCHLYGMAATGLRFFTVYGPWGRPDMAPMLFAKAISQGKPIKVFNNGNMKRDFTYIDDIVEGIVRVIDNPAAKDPDWNGKHPDPSRSCDPYRIYNIGNGSPVDLMEFIRVLEKGIGKQAVKQFLPMQPGDVPVTWADTCQIRSDLGYNSIVPIEEGLSKFVSWFLNYYQF